MFISLIRTTCVLAILVFAPLVLPVSHGIHDTAEQDCPLCQFRHSVIGDVAEMQSASDDLFKSSQLSGQVLTDSFSVASHLSLGSRGPPA